MLLSQHWQHILTENEHTSTAADAWLQSNAFLFCAIYGAVKTMRQRHMDA